MNFRDQEYIENRLLDSSNYVEAAGRLRQCGHDDLADEVIRETQEHNDKMRVIRSKISQRAVRSRQGR
jgi:hypothetical protein